MVVDQYTPEVMQDVPAWPHIALDQVRHHSVSDHPTDHSGGQHSRESAGPDVDDGYGHEGGGPQGTNDVDVAGGEVQDPEEDVEALGKQRALLAEEHLVRPL